MAESNPSRAAGARADAIRRPGGLGLALRPWLLGLLLAVATVAVYAPVRHYGFLEYDDADYVTDNPMVQAGLTWKGLRWAFTTEHAANWHPVTWLSHMLDVRLFGSSAAGPHLVNVLLHGANAALLLIALRWLTGALWRSTIVAAFFALHPLRVESVAWVAERKDVLSGFFFLLTVLAYVRWLRGRFAVGVPTATPNAPASPSAPPPSLLDPWYFVTLLAFALGLLSKPMLVTLPCVLLLLDLWPLRRFAADNRSVTRAVVEKLPFFALSLLSCVMTFAAQNAAGVVRSLAHLSIAARIGNTVVSYARYLAKLAWPRDLAVLYPHPGTWPTAQLVVSAAVVGLALALVIVRWRRRPVVSVGLLWFLGVLVPTIGLVQVSEQSMADRYSYLPSIGLFMAIVWTIGEIVGSRRVPKPLVAAVAVGLMALCAAGARVQLRTWRDGETLFRHALAVTRGNFAAHYNLGGTLLTQGRLDEAIAQFNASLQLRPGFADARCNLGSALLRQGRVDDAVAEFRRAVEAQPRHVIARCNLGLTLLQKGQVDEAIREFEAAAAVGPAGSIGRYYLGNVFLGRGQPDQAVAEYEKALAANPDHAAAHNNLAAALLRLGRVTEALRHFARALELQPNDPDTNSNFADVLLQRGLIDPAAARYRLALAGKPQNADAHCGLGTALVLQGKPDAAIAEFERALQLQPDSVIAHNNLGGLLLGKNRFADAVGHLQAALKNDPDNVRTLASLAWVLATCSDAAVRNGAAAVELAERAAQRSGNGDPRVLRALAAAYAESGRFGEASAVAQHAVQLAEAGADEPFAAILRSQLKLYQAGKPYHDAAPAAVR